ncbi:aldehyde dehydrogenase family protein [Kamptonema cortianum]|nr:aldehyde dehydrogenase family protein [Kamptonema cortianum]
MNPIELRSTFDQLRSAFSAEPMPSLEKRLENLGKLRRAVVTEQAALCRAMSEDFGFRSEYDNLFGDIIPILQMISYTRSKLRGWMRPSRRRAGLPLFGARVEVHPQPLGVVGIIAPWNFPAQLALMPLVTALAAGNRVMIKPSEFTPATGAALRKLLGSVFAGNEVAVIEGDAAIAEAFCKLPFDHLLFTGSARVGKKVMAAAAENLTPVTLELGGKSPCLIAPDMDIADAVRRLILGKCMNAGQICIAPDYVLLPEGKAEPFAHAFREQFARVYPRGIHDHAYSSVINAKHFARLTEWLAEARSGGAKVIPAAEPALDANAHRMAPHLLLNAPANCAVMQEEIFGPILPLVEYPSVEEAIDHIRSQPRPLAAYLMSHDKLLQKKIPAKDSLRGRLHQ